MSREGSFGSLACPATGGAGRALVALVLGIAGIGCWASGCCCSGRRVPAIASGGMLAAAGAPLADVLAGPVTASRADTCGPTAASPATRSSPTSTIGPSSTGASGSRRRDGRAWRTSTTSGSRCRSGSRSAAPTWRSTSTPWATGWWSCRASRRAWRPSCRRAASRPARRCRPTTPVRLRIDQVSAVEHATVAGVVLRAGRSDPHLGRRASARGHDPGAGGGDAGAGGGASAGRRLPACCWWPGWPPSRRPSGPSCWGCERPRASALSSERC